MYNQIEIQNVDTPYSYKQNMWMIDGKPLTAYLEDMVKERACEKLAVHKGTLSGLCPAGSGHMLFSYEREFVWELFNLDENKMCIRDSSNPAESERSSGRFPEQGRPLHPLSPVSYTHLDVYKRQAPFSSKEST